MAYFATKVLNLVEYFGGRDFLPSNSFVSNTLAANLMSCRNVLRNNMSPLWWRVASSERHFNKRRSTIHSKGLALSDQEFKTLRVKADRVLFREINEMVVRMDLRRRSSQMKNTGVGSDFYKIASGSLILLMGSLNTFQHIGDYADMVIVE